MATSGSQNFSQTRSELILDAFQLIGVYGIGRTVSAEDTTVAASFLNKMIKAWAVKGLHLWEKTEGVLYLTPHEEQYSLGNASTDAYATNVSDEVVTQLNGALATSATSVTVDSTTGMTVADKIGVVLTNKTIHWTTIATIPSSTTLTLTTGVASAASDNALVYTFTSRLYKPLRILEARRVTGIDTGATSTLTETPMTVIANKDFMNLSSKFKSSGSPNQYTYIPKNTNGLFYVFTRPSDGAERINFTYERIIEDLDNASDDFDFPSEWLEPITWQLALRLGPAFGRSDKAVKVIFPIASKMLDNLIEWDTETASLMFTPDLGGC
jgi:hypothetical protein